MKSKICTYIHKDDRMWYAYARCGVEDVVVFESLWTANAMIPIHALLSGFATTSKCLDLLARQRVMWSKQGFCQEGLLPRMLKLSSRDWNLNG